MHRAQLWLRPRKDIVHPPRSHPPRRGLTAPESDAAPQMAVLTRYASLLLLLLLLLMIPSAMANAKGKGKMTAEQAEQEAEEQAKQELVQDLLGGVIEHPGNADEQYLRELLLDGHVDEACEVARRMVESAVRPSTQNDASTSVSRNTPLPVDLRVCWSSL
jgi:hypothetical protein